MATRKEIKKTLQDLFGDGNVTAKRDGTYKVRRTYFYRMGMDELKWEERVLTSAKNKGLNLVATDRGDHFAAWPKTSYFWVTVREGA